MSGFDWTLVNKLAARSLGIRVGDGAGNVEILYLAWWVFDSLDRFNFGHDTVGLG